MKKTVLIGSNSFKNVKIQITLARLIKKTLVLWPLDKPNITPKQWAKKKRLNNKNNHKPLSGMSFIFLMTCYRIKGELSEISCQRTL